jgi:hypothetical protein
VGKTNAIGSRQDKTRSAMTTCANQGPNVKKTKRKVKNKQAVICLFGDAIAKGLPNTRLACVRGTAEVLRCWSVTAAWAKVRQVARRKIERDPAGRLAQAARHGKARKRASTRSLKACISLVANHGSTLAQHAHPLISLTVRFSLFCHFLESYLINILTHSIP